MKKFRLAAILIIIFVGFIVWFILISNNWNQNQDSSGLSQNQNEITRISETEVRDYTLLADGQIRALAANRPEFILIDSGTGAVSTDWLKPELFIVDQIVWAPDGNQAIVWYREDVVEPTVVKLLDFSAQSEKILNGDIISVAWAPDGKTIYYTFESENVRGETKLVRANPDTSDWQILLDPLPYAEPHLAIAKDGSLLTISNVINHQEDITPTTHQPIKLVDLETFSVTNLSQEGIFVAGQIDDSNQKVAALKVSLTSLNQNLTIINLAEGTAETYDLISNNNEFAWLPSGALIISARNITDGVNFTETAYLIKPGGSPQTIEGLNEVTNLGHWRFDSTNNLIYFLWNERIYYINSKFQF